MITSAQYAYLKSQGLDKTEVDKQHKLLSKGARFTVLNRPATTGDGIIPLSKENTKTYAHLFDRHHSSIVIKKFVPASGAATRMFKELSEFARAGKQSNTIKELFESFDKLAFAPLVPSNLTNQQQANYVLKNLNYQSIPKGLIPFHSYKGFTRTPFKEHWIEGLNYAATGGKVAIHFTVSKDHQPAFEKIYETRKKSFSEEHKFQLSVDFSQQLRATDTVVVDSDGNLLSKEDGSPILRPGGHGALIQNLNTQQADLVFIKNIDNIAHENHLPITALYKKALAGILLELKDKVFEQLRAIDNNEYDLNVLEHFGEETMVSIPIGYSGWKEPEKISFWKTVLNRPIRVCGMVKNEGEPGGGPFWVNNANGTSLQIVESAQIDTKNNKQATILKQSTHFNPVDLVCFITDYRGKPFNLLDYIDENTAFITNKTIDGKEVNVLEHPGLWNGAMANWITVFVEVPIETFNPVKTVNDLLKSSHQA